MMPLSALLSQLEADEAFVTDAMSELDSINSGLKVKSTYTRASAASALVNHWLVERELACYERGRIVEDVCAATVSVQDIERGIDAIEDAWKIDLKSLVELLQSKNISVPAYMIRFPEVDAGETANEENSSDRPLENWKMRVQEEATKRWLDQRALGCNPNPHSLKDELAKWCRDNKIFTKGNINPSPEYLYRHALSSRHWSPPTD